MRILFITNTPPIPSWGGAMTFYRHFCERNDFTISVITDNKDVENYEVPYPYKLVERGKIWKRITKTRFYQIPNTLGLLYTLGLPSGVLEFSREFKPDAIYTVAGSWSWMALMAKEVALKLNVPLIGSFNDWWNYNSIFHPIAESRIERKFRAFYNDCDLVLCTSEGMQKSLGEHKNSIVLYPTGALMDSLKVLKLEAESKEFTVAFGGNLGDWYGVMLENIVTAAKGLGIKFKIFGSNPSWSKEFNEYVINTGVFLGQITFEQLQLEMSNVNALLLLMGFDESCRIIETTSFKTKFLDYLSFQKPIILWGPDYCSAVVIAQEYLSAEICTSNNANELVKSIIKVKEDPQLQIELVRRGQKMYEERFHPDKIHLKLVESIQGIIRKN